MRICLTFPSPSKVVRHSAPARSSPKESEAMEKDLAAELAAEVKVEWADEDPLDLEDSLVTWKQLPKLGRVIWLIFSFCWDLWYTSPLLLFQTLEALWSKAAHRGSKPKVNVWGMIKNALL